MPIDWANSKNNEELLASIFRICNVKPTLQEKKDIAEDFGRGMTVKIVDHRLGFYRRGGKSSNDGTSSTPRTTRRNPITPSSKQRAMPGQGGLDTLVEISSGDEGRSAGKKRALKMDEDEDNDLGNSRTFKKKTKKDDGDAKVSLKKVEGEAKYVKLPTPPRAPTKKKTANAVKKQESSDDDITLDGDF